MLIFTPDRVIAGSVDVLGKASPEEVAYHNARYVLDADAISIIISFEAGRVYFLAAPAEAFIGRPDSLTDLSAALPGMPGHKGDGAYKASTDTQSAVIVRRGSDLQSYVGSEDEVADFIRGSDAHLIPIDSETASPWTTFNLAMERRVASLAKVLTVTGGVLTGVLALVMVGMTFFSRSGQEEIEVIRRQVDQQTRRSQTAVELFVSRPIYRDLEELGRVGALAAATNGWIEKFTVDGGQVAWSAVVPQFVNADYINRFGSNIIITPDPASGWIRLSKKGK